MNLKTLFWPWGRIAELEAEVDYLESELEESEDEALEYAAALLRAQMFEVANCRNFGISALALTDIVTAIGGIKVPNGTTRKIERLAKEALALLEPQLTPELAATARSCLDAELAEAQIKVEAV